MAAAPAGAVDLSRRDMRGDDLTDLDLSGANLTGANLTGANLHGVKLVGSNLTGADLTEANLTIAWIIRANFTNARLHSATMQTVVTSTGMDNTSDQAAIFVGANLSDASITVHFSFDDMRGADFSHAHMTVIMANQSMGLLRTDFIAAKLTGANFTGRGIRARHLPLCQTGRHALRWSRPEQHGVRRYRSDRGGLHGRQNVGRDVRECHVDGREGTRSIRDQMILRRTFRAPAASRSTRHQAALQSLHNAPGDIRCSAEDERRSRSWSIAGRYRRRQERLWHRAPAWTACRNVWPTSSGGCGVYPPRLPHSSRTAWRQSCTGPRYRRELARSVSSWFDR